jgi:hypothetical protein
MVVCPVIEFKAVESHPLMTDRDLGQVRSNLTVESIAIHTEIAGRIPEPDKPRWK